MAGKIHTKRKAKARMHYKGARLRKGLKGGKHRGRMMKRS